MLQFRIKDLLVFTAWIAVCLSLLAFLELNTAGIVVGLVGWGVSLVGLLFGRVGRGIIVAAAIYAICALGLTRVAVGDGYFAVTIEIVVCDLNTGRRIGCASIALRDLSAELERGPDMTSVFGVHVSDVEGKAVAVLRLPLTVHTTLFTESERVNCDKWLYLRIERTGYEGVDCYLADRIGRSFRPTNKPFHIRIEMQRAEKQKEDDATKR
jgi:hypothetical protein